jgi:hypothetical protein
MPVPVSRRFIATVIASLSLGGCGGGGDNAGPDDAFPDVSGVYSIQGGFDGFTSDEAAFAGRLMLNQASRQSEELTGSLSMTITAQGQVNSTGEVPLQAASLSQKGAVSFRLGPSTVSGWTFTGTVAGGTITGRHTLTDGQTVAFPGDWNATTATAGTGGLTVSASTSGSPLDPDGYTLSIDGAVWDTLGGNDQVTFSAVAPGNHTVGLSLVASSCHVQGQNPRLVTIKMGETVSETFEVVCGGS